MSAEAAKVPTPRRTNWNSPVRIVVGGLIVAAVIWFVVRFDTGHRNMAILADFGVTFMILLGWVVLRSRLPWSRRLPLIGVMIAPVLLMRIDGCQGDLVPIIAWRWSQRPDYALSRQVDKTSSEVDKPDLSHTTPQDYPRFLGPDATGKIIGVHLDPDWKAHPPREVWRREIGAGWSGFSVVGDYAVTQEQRGDFEAVVCYRWKTGEPIWIHTNPGRHDTAMGGVGPRATPTIDRGVVYTLGALGLLQALDGKTGTPLWSRNVLEEHKSSVPDWGKSCSPLVVDDLVIVSVGGDQERGLAAYQRQTGDPVWHAGNDRTSYATPVLAMLHGTRQIVMLNGASVTSHDVPTGKVLWTFDWPGPAPKVAQPIAVDDHRVLISSGYGYGCRMLDVSFADGQWSVKELWTSSQLNPKLMNPILYEGHIYGLDDGIAMSCLDLDTGKRLWKRGRYGHGQILLVDNLILVQAENGDVALVEPNPKEHRELARFTALHDRTWNNPTLVGSHLLVRNNLEAACFELPLRP